MWSCIPLGSRRLHLHKLGIILLCVDKYTSNELTRVAHPEQPTASGKLWLTQVRDGELLRREPGNIEYIAKRRISGEYSLEASSVRETLLIVHVVSSMAYLRFIAHSIQSPSWPSQSRKALQGVGSHGLGWVDIHCPVKQTWISERNRRHRQAQTRRKASICH